MLAGSKRLSRPWRDSAFLSNPSVLSHCKTLFLQYRV